jgi:hypothetical protein
MIYTHVLQPGGFVPPVRHAAGTRPAAQARRSTPQGHAGTVKSPLDE